MLAVTVDHGLNPQSSDWTRRAAAAAEAVDAGFRSLAWTGAKPTTGLPAAARSARHRLIAGAAHEAGASVILLGHTRDDVLETALMRQAGSTLGRLTEWSPSPVWPEGRGLFHLRPLMDCRRDDLRRGLAAAGWQWVEDPANTDARYARARARQSLGAGAAPLLDEPHDLSICMDLANALEAQSWGGFTMDRSVLCAAPRHAAVRVLAAALTCAAGVESPPQPSKVGSLLARLGSAERVIAGLAGARLEADGHVLIAREAGERARAGLQPLALSAGPPVVWDGRFELVVDTPGLAVQALRGVAARLAPSERAALKLIPAAARGGLPAVGGGEGPVSSPVLADIPGVRCRLLSGDRLRAACGLITREA